jgi:hypothetical protein
MRNPAAMCCSYGVLRGSKIQAAKFSFIWRNGLTLAALLFICLPFGQAQSVPQVINQPLAAGPRRPATVPEGYVITPAGYFHESCVRTLAKGERLLADGRVQHADGTIDQDVAVCSHPRYTPAGVLISPNATNKNAQSAKGTIATEPEISGWLEDAEINTGSKTSSYGALVAMWTVPPQPASDDGQTLFFFPGFQDINGAVNGVYTILQPVLAWAGGQWSIASWNCCITGVISKSPTVSVSPGDRIYGSITNTCAVGTLSCPTWNVLTLDMSTGYSTTLADAPSDGEIFNWAFGAVLEPYYIVSCDDYPPNGHLSFDQIKVFNQYLKPIPGENWLEVLDNTTNPPRCDYAVVQREYGHQVTLDY